MSIKKIKEEIELFYAYLRQHGLKKTYQKDLILETFLNTEGHLSVEDIYALVKKKDKKVGVVTVFRTLKSLTACGMAREISLGDGLTRFEHNYRHPYHHHIVCTECHKAIEFVCPELEKIQNEIIQKYHFQPLHHRFQTYGICQECRESRTTTEVQKHDTEKVFARDAVKMALSMEKRGIEFYREAVKRNQDSGGREIFEGIIKEEELHIANLEAKLEEINRQEKDLEHAPVFLHFNIRDLEELMPNLDHYEVSGELRLSAQQSLKVAMAVEQRAADFFKAYADKFTETQGKQIFLNFADDEIKHFEKIREKMVQPSAPLSQQDLHQPTTSDFKFDPQEN